jgi:hypothetical protein
MATRFYGLNWAPPYRPLTLEGNWSTTLALANTKAMDVYKWGGVALSFGASESSATNPFKLPVVQLVSRRLAPQTISGTVQICWGVSESTSAANMFTRLHIYVVNVDTGVILGTLLNEYTESSGGGATEWPTTNAGRQLQSAQALSALVVPDDRHVIVAVLGASCENSDTTTRSATVRCQARASRSSGGGQLADLTAGSLSTTTRAPWIEFSGTITLAADVIPNVTEDFAVDLGTLPIAPLPVDMADGDFLCPRWYSFTPAQDLILNLWAQDSAFPTGPNTYTQLFLGPAASITQVLDLDDAGSDGRAIQYPVVAGQEYLFQFFPTSFGSNPPLEITISGQAFSPVALTPNPILVPDDTSGYPAALVDSTTGQILEFVRPFPPGESAYALPNYVLTEDNTDLLTKTNRLYQWDGTTLTEIAAFLAGDDAITIRGRITGAGTAFYFTDDQIQTVYQVDPATASIVASWVLPTTPYSIAVSPDQTILYYTSLNAGVYAISRYDLVNDAPLSDLVSEPMSTWFPEGSPMLCLESGNIVWAAADTGAADPTFIVHVYSPAGALITSRTFDFASDELRTALDSQVFASLNNDTTFLVWLKVDTPNVDVGGIHFGKGRYYEMNATTGAITFLFETEFYELGVHQGDPATFSVPTWGTSESCPAVVLRTSVVPPPDCPGDLGSPRTDGLPYTPPVLPPCAGSGTLGPPRTGAWVRRNGISRRAA